MAKGPKKYIKVDGRLMVNPEYKAFMNSKREEEDADYEIVEAAPIIPAIEPEPESESESEKEEDTKPATVSNVDLEHTVNGKISSARGKYATVAGGNNNHANGEMATIGGGGGNTAVGKATVGGGRMNQAKKKRSTVSGGVRNVAGGTESTVGGGQGNTAANPGSTVAGGVDNNANGNYSVVGGGNTNTAMSRLTTVCGGRRNEALGDFSTIIGGRDNTTGGQYATVLGGDKNEASGNYSVAAGRCAEATHHRACVINCDMENEQIARSKTNGEFRVHAMQFTICIDGIEATIDKQSIRAFANSVKGGNDLQKRLDDQEEQIKKMQRQIERLLKN